MSVRGRFNIYVLLPSASKSCDELSISMYHLFRLVVLHLAHHRPVAEIVGVKCAYVVNRNVVLIELILKHQCAHLVEIRRIKSLFDFLKR